MKPAFLRGKKIPILKCFQFAALPYETHSESMKKIEKISRFCFPYIQILFDTSEDLTGWACSQG